jgi:uncharacterized protein YggE
LSAIRSRTSDVIVNDIAKVGRARYAYCSGQSVLWRRLRNRGEKPLAERARRAAVTDAVAKARTIAEAAGVVLGPILSIQEGRSGFVPPGPRVFAATAEGPPPVAAGEQTVTVSVTVTYTIQ